MFNLVTWKNLKHLLITLSTLCVWVIAGTHCTKEASRATVKEKTVSHLEEKKSNGFEASSAKDAKTNADGTKTPQESSFDSGVEAGSSYADNDPRRSTTMLVMEGGTIGVTYGPELDKVAASNPDVAAALDPNNKGAALFLEEDTTKIDAALEDTVHSFPFNIDDQKQIQPYKLHTKAPEEKAKLALFILDKEKKLKYILQKEADSHNWQSMEEAKSLADNIDIFCLQKVIDENSKKVLQLVVFNDIGARSTILTDESALTFSAFKDEPEFTPAKISKCLANSGKIQRESGLAVLTSRQKDLDLAKAGEQQQANLALVADRHEICTIIVTGLIVAIGVYFLVSFIARRLFQKLAQSFLKKALIAAGIGSLSIILASTGSFDIFGKFLWINKIAGGICKILKDGCLLGDFCLVGMPDGPPAPAATVPVPPVMRKEDEHPVAKPRDLENYNN